MQRALICRHTVIASAITISPHDPGERTVKNRRNIAAGHKLGKVVISEGKNATRGDTGARGTRP